MLHDDPVGAGLDLGGATVIVHPTHTTNETARTAAVTLPTTMSVETLGTFVNEAGRAQLLRPAKTIRSLNRSLMMAMGTGQSRTDRVGTPFDRWHDESNRVDALPGWASIPEVAKGLGHTISAKSPAAVLAGVAGRNAAFAGLSHDAMGYTGVELTDASPAEASTEA